MFTRLIQIHLGITAGPEATEQQSQGTPRWAATSYVPTVLCRRGESRGFIRVWPAMFITPTHTKAWPCEGRTSLIVMLFWYEQGTNGLPKKKWPCPRAKQLSSFLSLSGSTGESSTPGDQAGHSRLTVLWSTCLAEWGLQESGGWSEWFSPDGASESPVGVRKPLLWLQESHYSRLVLGYGNRV